MGALLIWWLVLEALGLAALPLLSAVFSARADHGYAFGKIVALLVVSYISWLLASTGLVALRVALPLTVAVLPWARLAGLTLRVVVVGVNVTVFQYLIRLATSTEPSPVARS